METEEDIFPPLTAENAVRLEVLMELFYKQLWTFSEYVNQVPDKVPTWRFADFVLYAMQERLEQDKR